MGAEHGIPVELAEHRIAVRIHQPERVHAKALHHPETARDGAIGHQPHQHVGGFGHQRNEIPEGVVGGCGLWHRMMRLGLHRVHQIRKLDRVLDEENRHVVAHQVPVALVGIELHRETAHIASRVLGAPLASHGGEAHEYRRALAGGFERGGSGEFGQALVGFEIAVRAGTPRMHDTLGNPFVVEMGDLLAQDEILEQRGPTQTGLQAVLVVRHRHALVGGQAAITGIVAHAQQRAAAGVHARQRRFAGLSGVVALAHRAGGRVRRGRWNMLALRRIQRMFQTVLGRLAGVVLALA